MSTTDYDDSHILRIFTDSHCMYEISILWIKIYSASHTLTVILFNVSIQFSVQQYWDEIGFWTEWIVDSHYVRNFNTVNQNIFSPGHIDEIRCVCGGGGGEGRSLTMSHVNSVIVFKLYLIVFILTILLLELQFLLEEIIFLICDIGLTTNRLIL